MAIGDGGAIQSDAKEAFGLKTEEAWQMAAAKLSDAAFSAILEAHPGLRDRFVSIAMAGAKFGGKSQGGRRDRRADCRGNAAFGAGGDAGLGRERGRSDGERNSSTTCDASPR